MIPRKLATSPARWPLPSQNVRLRTSSIITGHMRIRPSRHPTLLLSPHSTGTTTGNLLMQATRRPRRLRARAEVLEDRRLLTLRGDHLLPSDNPWKESVAGAPAASNSALKASVDISGL